MHKTLEVKGFVLFLHVNVCVRKASYLLVCLVSDNCILRNVIFDVTI